MITRLHAVTLLPLVTLIACGTDEEPRPTCVAKGDICTVAGTGVAGFAGDEGQAINADFYMPMDMLVAADGTLYVVDWNNHRLRSVDPKGVVRTLAGDGVLGDDEGLEREASFNHPTNLTWDPLGRIVIAAWHNSRVKRYDPATSRIENICGTGKRAYGGDGGLANVADLDLPSSVVYDAEGTLFIMDQANQIIRKVDAAGVITRVAGQCIAGTCAAGEEPVQCPNSGKMACGGKCGEPCAATFGGDGGPATLARLAQPVGQAADPGGRMTFDAQGNLYFADTKNHRIRRIGTDGVINTVVGTGERGTTPDGDALATKLNRPVDVEVAPDGTLYFTDTGNSCVRALKDGRVTTVAGQCGTRGGTGDGGPATAALLDSSYGITFDRDGNLFIADTVNSRVRKVLLK